MLLAHDCFSEGVHRGFLPQRGMLIHPARYLGAHLYASRLFRVWRWLALTRIVVGAGGALLLTTARTEDDYEDIKQHRPNGFWHERACHHAECSDEPSGSAGAICQCGEYSATGARHG